MQQKNHPAAAADVSQDLSAVKQELEEAQKTAAEYLGGWQRARADYANLQKETEKRFRDLQNYAAEDLISQLLPIYDHFEIAWRHLPAESVNQDWVKGVGLIKNQLWELLKSYGLEKIKTSGCSFDPQLHEAVGEAEGEGLSQAIAEEVSAGYLLHDKVLRPAKVKVFK